MISLFFLKSIILDTKISRTIAQFHHYFIYPIYSGTNQLFGNQSIESLIVLVRDCLISLSIVRYSLSGKEWMVQYSFHPYN